ANQPRRRHHGGPHVRRPRPERSRGPADARPSRAKCWYLSAARRRHGRSRRAHACRWPAALFVGFEFPDHWLILPLPLVPFGPFVFLVIIAIGVSVVAACHLRARQAFPRPR